MQNERTGRSFGYLHRVCGFAHFDRNPFLHSIYMVDIEMKYLDIDPEVAEEYAEIWIEFALALNPNINEVRAQELMAEFFVLNNCFDKRGAALLGTMLKKTEDTVTKEIH